MLIYLLQSTINSSVNLYQRPKKEGSTGNATEKYVAGKIGDFTENLYDQAREAKSIDYGADAPVGTAKHVLDKVNENIHPIDLEK